MKALAKAPCTHVGVKLVHNQHSPLRMWLQEVPRIWSNPPYNFDNIGMALVSLFVTVTLNGYMGGCRCLGGGGGLISRRVAKHLGCT